MDKTLLIATNNAGKVVEIGALLADVPILVIGLSDFPTVGDVEEMGTTFRENAVLKALTYAKATGLAALADDSGLEVAALDNRPGIYSARYGGDRLTFADKMQKLLGELDETGDEDRRARFVCALALADENGGILFECEGVCEGRIAAEPRGSGGFGYDPIFVPDGYESTFGELPEGVKHKISHRARAFSQIIPFLRGFFAISA